MGYAAPQQGMAAVGRDFLWRSKTNLSDAEFRMVLVLECLAGEAPACQPGNGALARLVGKDARSVKRTLAGLEGKGWVRRGISTSGGTQRREIRLLRRARDPVPGVARRRGGAIR